MLEDRAAELLAPDQTALMVIDMQNDFCAREGDAGRRGAQLEPVHAMVTRLQALIAAARSAGVKIVFVRTEHSAWSDSPSWRARLGKNRPPNCVPGSWGAEFFGPLQPEPGDLVVTKHRYSALMGTNLNLALRSNGIRTVVITGTKTNGCVDSTARDAYMHDYFVVVPPDGCVTGDGPAFHDAALKLLGHAFAALVPGPEVSSIWGNARRSEPTAGNERKEPQGVKD